MAVTDRFDVPPEMRAFAEKSVEQARQAFDGFISAAHHAVNAFEGQAQTARKGAKDVTERPSLSPNRMSRARSSLLNNCCWRKIFRTS